MEGATLLDKTKWRLNGSKTLKEWAMKTVQTNLHAFTQIQGGSYIQSKLSPRLRDEVLQELQRSKRPEGNRTEEQFISMKRTVLALMNTMTKKLDLDHLMAFHPRDFESHLEFHEVLTKVLIAAPNVRHLIIHFENLTHIYHRILINFGHLSSLKELRILKITGYIENDITLALLCEKLPNLQILGTNFFNLEDVNISEEEIKNSFGHLRLFECRMSSFTRDVFLKWLPQLDVVSDVRRIGLTLEEFVEDENFQPRERKYIDLAEEPNACADINIRCLEFNLDESRWNDGYKKSLTVPTTLDSLILQMFDYKAPVEDILIEYGANLRFLFLIGTGYENLQLNHISEQCPKLEVLKLKTRRFPEISTQQAHFRHLRELVMENYACFMGTSVAAVLSSCPNLQKLVLCGERYSLDDLVQVKNLIIEKKVLGSLQSLRWTISKFTRGVEFKEIAAIVKIASATLPDLKELKLSFMGYFPESIYLIDAWSLRYELLEEGFRKCLIEAFIAQKNISEFLNIYDYS